MKLLLSTLSILVLMGSLEFIQSSPQKGFVFDTKNKENVVASRLEGTWRLESSRVNGIVKESKKRVSLRFTFDESAIPQRVFKKIGKRLPFKLVVYGVGRVKGLWKGKDVPFFLTSMNGNPQIVWFRERNGDPFGNSESFHVMLARGGKQENDLLFKGGDFNNQAFDTYARKSTSPLVKGEYQVALDALDRALLRMRSLSDPLQALEATKEARKALADAYRALRKIESKEH